MKVLKENLAGVVVLTLKGEFDSFVTNAFGNEIQKVHDEGTHRIVLNMRLVKFVNSTALGAMIKARKGARQAGGDLVISQPSAAVREAMESLGLDRLFSIHDDDEAACAALDKSGGVEMDGDSESAVMIHVPESTRPVVARLTRLDADALSCRLASRAGGLTEGRGLRLKFRLPLYRKEYFDVAGRVERIEEPADGGVEVTLRLVEMSDEDREAIERFVKDMTELRRAARGE